MRSTTLILVLSALAAGISSAHPIIGANDGGDASSGDAGNARGGDIIINQKGQVKIDPAMSPGFWNYQGGQKVETGAGGVASSGTAYGTDGQLQVKRQGDSGDQLERRLLDGGSENTQTGGLLDGILSSGSSRSGSQKRLLNGSSENTQSGGLLGNLLDTGNNPGATGPPQKRLLDGGSENTQSGGLLGNLLGNDKMAASTQAQRRLLDGGSENTQSGGLLGGLLARDQHPNDKRLLDGGSEIDRCGGKGMSRRLLDGGSEITTCNQGLLGNLVSRSNSHVKRILDFFNAEESSSPLPIKRLLDFGRGQKFSHDSEVTYEYVDRQSTSAPESKRFLDPKQAKELFKAGEEIMDTHGPSKRLLDAMGAPDQEPPSGLLGGILGRSNEHEEKRSIGEVSEQFGDLAKSGKKLGGATGGQRLETGNGGNSTSGDAYAGDAALTGGSGGDASTGSAGDVSGGSIKLQQKRQEVPATDSSSIDPAEAAEAVGAAEPKELTPMDKSVAAASGFAGSKLGKITHFDMIAEAAAPAAPLLQE